MSHPLDGCWAKVNRADVHLRFLDERVEAFVNSDAYRVETESGPQAGEMIIYGEALREPPMEEWGAIVGDAVHNLRSALDHLVWQLTIASGHKPPPVIPRKGPGSEWRRAVFPIYTMPHPTDRAGNVIPWSTAKEPESLWGVRPNLRADLQGLQPFNRGKDAAKEPLAVLDELWNIDKHRHLALAVFMFGLHDVGSRRPFSFAPEITLRVLKKHPPGPFEGRAEIGRIEQVGPPYAVFPEVYVEPAIEFDVAFEKGPPAYGGRVVKTLIGLHDTVAAILAQFDSAFP